MKSISEFLGGFYRINTYQMIYTTSLIPEEYHNEDYCVGDCYTEESSSLNNV
ncbi:hypothetical protein [Tenacibaculum maritimum]|uniref:hypothetical protein n=1 Tax=Tenacibaculum maritimum TaxID=107401 RepID=UPI001330BD30|nr:hypothetical protein [Tenacibaculum maritimum]MCD9581646.1 hypothetical protein [Tenacibaculum maritimum]MCD9636138.1 hypothetical protein [Tenacibaculum maritimum]